MTITEFREISNFDRQQTCTNPQQQGSSMECLIEGRDGAVKEARLSQLSVPHLQNFPHQILVPRFLYRANFQRRAPPESLCQVLSGQQTVTGYVTFPLPKPAYQILIQYVHTLHIRVLNGYTYKVKPA
jgi:hypothetical protein